VFTAVSEGIGGVGYRANRVQLVVDRNHEHADTLIQAITHLNDPRITLELYTSTRTERRSR
jgi:hypothetical protein